MQIRRAAVIGLILLTACTGSVVEDTFVEIETTTTGSQAPTTTILDLSAELAEAMAQVALLEDQVEDENRKAAGSGP